MTASGKHTYYNMMQSGATTLWERWDGLWSHNHPMFGGCSSHLFSSILGITQEQDSVGFEKLVIAPQVPQKLQKASGSVVIAAGEVSVAFEQVGSRVIFDIVLPEGKTAAFKFGAVELKLNGGKHHIRL